MPGSTPTPPEGEFPALPHPASIQLADKSPPTLSLHMCASLVLFFPTANPSLLSSSTALGRIQAKQSNLAKQVMTSRGAQGSSQSPTLAHGDNYHDADAHHYQSQESNDMNDSHGLNGSHLQPTMLPPPSVAVAIKAIGDHHNGSSWRDHHDGMFNSPYSTSHPSTAPGSPRMYAPSSPDRLRLLQPS